jgi:hypothetical protein
MEVAEWKEQWRKDAIDFLLDEHSPQTKRALEQMRSSQMLRAVIDADGPARRTRAKRKLLRIDGVGSRGAGSTSAGHSGTVDDPMVE